MKVGIYVRVSTTDQTTLNQELILKEYCERHDWTIYKIYREEGISGAKVSRPQLDILLQDMRQRYFDAILVWKLDRLGRSVQHLLQILQEMDSKKIRLIITDMGLDTSTAQGKFFFTVIGAVAELEREMIRDRIMAGLSRAKKEGKVGGRPKGSKDKKVRRKSGYYRRWSK